MDTILFWTLILIKSFFLHFFLKMHFTYCRGRGSGRGNGLIGRTSTRQGLSISSESRPLDEAPRGVVRGSRCRTRPFVAWSETPRFERCRCVLNASRIPPYIFNNYYVYFCVILTQRPEAHQKLEICQ